MLFLRKNGQPNSKQKQKTDIKSNTTEHFIGGLDMLIAKRGFGILVFVTAAFLAFAVLPAHANTIFFEDFENGALGWSKSNGVWQVGLPTVGPQDCNAGNNLNSKKCAYNWIKRIP